MYNTSYFNSFIRDVFYCEPSIFWENVGSDREEVLSLIKKAQSREELETIANKYI